MSTQRPLRVLIAKAGLDGHDRGAKIVARAFREAGCEVIFTGLHQTPAQVAQTAVDEDVDAIGLSVHAGAHLTLFADLFAALDNFGSEIPVFGGGIIPSVDRPALQELGVKAIFGPGTPLGEIVSRTLANCSRR